MVLADWQQPFIGKSIRNVGNTFKFSAYIISHRQYWDNAICIMVPNGQLVQGRSKKLAPPPGREP
jgi:hypothetical protein